MINPCLEESTGLGCMSGENQYRYRNLLGRVVFWLAGTRGAHIGFAGRCHTPYTPRHPGLLGGSPVGIQSYRTSGTVRTETIYGRRLGRAQSYLLRFGMWMFLGRAYTSRTPRKICKQLVDLSSSVEHMCVQKEIEESSTPRSLVHHVN